MDVTRASVASVLLLTLLVLGLALIGPASGHGPGGGVSVSIDETNAPISVGETLEVTIELENSANATRTQRAVLYIGGEVRDSETLSMRAGERRVITLTWKTQPGDGGDYEATVEVGDDTDRVAIAVQTPPALNISITETNAPINATETLAVTAAVSNSGGAEGTAEVSLSTNETIRDSATVSVAGGSTQEVTLTWETATADVGEYVATVVMKNETVSRPIEITEAPTSPNATNDAPRASIHIDTEAEVFEAGEQIQFTANASDPDGEVVSYEWRIDGEQVSTDATFEYTFEEGGSHQVRLVVTDDDRTPTTVSRTIQVEARTTTARSQTAVETTTGTGSSGAGFGVLVTVVAVAFYAILRRWQ